MNSVCHLVEFSVATSSELILNNLLLNGNISQCDGSPVSCFFKCDDDYFIHGEDVSRAIIVLPSEDGLIVPEVPRCIKRKYTHIHAYRHLTENFWY